MSKPHGVRGSVVVRLETDNPRRFAPGSRLVTGDGRTLTVTASSPGDGTARVQFAEVADRDAAEQLRGTVLLIPAEERRSLGSDEFWPEELIGLTARHPEGEPIGEVVDIVEGAAQERLVIRLPEGREVEVPFVAELVPEVVIEEGYLTVSPLEGLL